jgi:hypothetical protein
MNKTVEMVQKLSDAQVVGVTKELFRSVYAEISYDEVHSNFAAVAEVGPLVALGEAALRRELTAEDSSRLGRLVLDQCARDAAMEQLVRNAIDKVRSSDDLVVDIILAIGLVVNLTLLLATTKFSARKGPDGRLKWQISKKEASPEIVKAIVEPVVNVAKAAK